MFDVDGVMHELKYNMKTIEKIETATGKGLVSNIGQNQGILSIGDLKTYFGMALYNDEGQRVAHTQGIKIAEKLIETEGFMKVNEAVIVGIDRDCPFLFQTD